MRGKQISIVVSMAIVWVVVLSLSNPVFAQPGLSVPPDYDLYDGVMWSKEWGDQTMGQRFTPASSEPAANRPPLSLEFDSFGVYLQWWRSFDLAWVHLYEWQGDYTSTVSSTPLGSWSRTVIVDPPQDVSNPAGEEWFMFDLAAPLPVDGSYYWELKAVTSTYLGGTSLRCWATGQKGTGGNTGGLDNDSWSNNSGPKDWENQTRLHIVPEPTALVLLGFAVCMAMRKR